MSSSRDARGLRSLLSSRPVQGLPVRWLVRHGRADDRDLLQAELPRTAAVCPQRAFLPHCGRRARAGIPGLQALQARRVPRVTRVERPQRRRGPRHATDRRRHRRPRRGHGTRGPYRIHHPPTRTAAAGRGGRQSPRLGARAAHADRAGAHRDDGPAVRRRRLRRWLLQHPPVQRHRDGRDRTDADSPAAACANAFRAAATPTGSGV